MKKLLTILMMAGLVTLGAATVSAQTDTAPKSVVHIVTVAWKEGTTEAQIKAALDGVKALPAKYKGLTHVWTKTIKIQNPKGAEPKSHVFVMEFADEAAFKAYTDSPAQLEWYKVYLPIRGTSTTHDVSN